MLVGRHIGLSNRSSDDNSQEGDSRETQQEIRRLRCRVEEVLQETAQEYGVGFRMRRSGSSRNHRWSSSTRRPEHAQSSATYNLRHCQNVPSDVRPQAVAQQSNHFRKNNAPDSSLLSGALRLKSESFLQLRNSAANDF